MKKIDQKLAALSLRPGGSSVRPLFPSADQYLHFGFASRRFEPPPQREFHRHNEIELILLERGKLLHLMGGRVVQWRSGRLNVFWGAIPHAPLTFQAHSLLNRLTLPLAWFLEWRLPRPLTDAILAGETITAQDDRDATADLAMFWRWHEDMKDGSADRRKTVLLECEARLRRLHQSMPAPGGGRGGSAQGRRDTSKVETMARFVALHYTEPLRIADIARNAGLHPDYAATLFRKVCGMGLADYVTEHRVSHAQRLLATTDEKIVDIAYVSGFGAASRFYNNFKKVCGRTPREYRLDTTRNEGG